MCIDEIYRKGENLMKVTALTSDGELLTCGGFGNLQCLAFDMDTNSWQPHSSLDKGKIHIIGFEKLQCLAFELKTNSWQPHSSLDTSKIHYIGFDIIKMSCA